MLFSCSIRDNIAYGAVDPDAVTTEDIYRAAQVANAYNFIQTFPKGFDTVVGEKGVLLSGEKTGRHDRVMKTTSTSLLMQANCQLSFSNSHLSQKYMFLVCIHF